MINIALNTIKEIIRNKFLYLIIVFAFLFIIFSISLWALTIWENDKVIVDFWIAMIEIFWFIWVIFVWSQLLFKEIEWKTIFLILSKPIKRYEFIIWKFLWFWVVIFLITLFQSLLYLLVLFFNNIEITSLILMSLFFIFLKLLTLISIVLLLSTFMSTILTIMVSVFIYFVSHSYEIVLDLVHRMWNEIIIFVSKIIGLLFPPFSSLNTKDYIWSIVEFSFVYYLLNTTYALLYITIALILASVIFNKKKFEN